MTRRAPGVRLWNPLVVIVAIVLSLATASNVRAADTYQVVHTFPHDEHAFTQGLVFVDGHLYESTGIAGQSSLRMENLETGEILRFQEIPNKYFAEGLTNWKDTLVQLTWQAHTAFVYDRATFRLLRTFQYDGEGWGLTQDGKNLILSDGTATLRFIDPNSFREVRRLVVRNHGKPVTQLNELEFAHGEILANIWHSDRIARVSPASGKVLGWIDLAGLLPESQRSSPEAVLNGIAYDAATDRLFVTGKLWPLIFEIRIVPSSAASVPSRNGK